LLIGPAERRCEHHQRRGRFGAVVDEVVRRAARDEGDVSGLHRQRRAIQPQGSAACGQGDGEIVAAVHVRRLAIADLHQGDAAVLAALQLGRANVLGRPERHRDRCDLRGLRRLRAQEVRRRMRGAPGEEHRRDQPHPIHGVPL
jgi:hypothetical protein